MKNSESDWKNKFQDLVNSCQVELKKTTQIGLKMLSASQSNALLHESFEELGRIVYEQLKNDKLDLKSEGIKELIGKISKLEHELELCEDEVQKIKSSSSVE